MQEKGQDEVDLQLIMRILTNKDNEEKIEKDYKFSKSNYGSRKKYSIKLIILTKDWYMTVVYYKNKIYVLTNL